MLVKMLQHKPWIVIFSKDKCPDVKGHMSSDGEIMNQGLPLLPRYYKK